MPAPTNDHSPNCACRDCFSPCPVSKCTEPATVIVCRDHYRSAQRIPEPKHDDDKGVCAFNDCDAKAVRAWRHFDARDSLLFCRDHFRDMTAVLR